MRKSLLLIPLLTLLWCTGVSQITSIGLIGDATPGGWDADTNMVQDPVDTNAWTLTIELTDGKVKFRANDLWDDDWGGADFPVGQSVYKGADIVVTAGIYNIKFYVDGAYTFNQVPDSIISLGLIGDALPDAWNSDTNFVQDTANPDLYHLAIDLADGNVKIRANDDWAVNWGNDAFPRGFGIRSSQPNIPVFGGRYDITFDLKYAEYDFRVQSPIGLVGEATPLRSWDVDVNMYQDQQDSNKFFLETDLIAGKVKFRKDDAWDVNWGAADFPTGIGTQGGPDIVIPNAGTYFITFDTATGEYNFEEIVDFADVGIIGDAANGWDSVTVMMKDGMNPDLWTMSITLNDGGAQFTSNDGEFLWGAADFPTGTASLESADTIPVTAGKYLVSFNTKTGEYEFAEVIIYETIGIIGSATPNGWEGDDFDLERSPSDSSQWTLRMELLDGEAKFRADNDWAVNWGSGDFPSGTAEMPGANIPVTAGDYVINFNSFTGAYSFELVIEYDAISIVGKSGPFGDWPGDDASRDWFMDKDANDPQVWTTKEITLTEHMGADDEGVKFRADTAWTINWGADDFPSGVGTQGGPNIKTIAGTYDVMLNSATGAYAFVEPGSVSTRDFIDDKLVKIFPNPVINTLYIDLGSMEYEGAVDFRVYDLSGKMLLEQRRNSGSELRMNVSRLQPGQYVLQVLNDKFVLGKKFVIGE